MKPTAWSERLLAAALKLAAAVLVFTWTVQLLEPLLPWLLLGGVVFGVIRLLSWRYRR